MGTRTNLREFIDQSKMVDTHEHLNSAKQYTENPPDVLQELFENYIGSDLRVAGASQDAIEKLVQPGESSISKRFQAISQAWQHCQFTGYGKAVLGVAKEVFGLDELTPKSLEAAEESRRQQSKRPSRLDILRDTANLDHVQIDSFSWKLSRDPEDPAFFRYDLSWADFSNGNLNLEELAADTGIIILNSASLREAFESIFARNADIAIAVKSQHAYERTLDWAEVEDQECDRILSKLARSEKLSDKEKIILGNWSIHEGARLCSEHDLTFKLHVGYHAGTGYSNLKNTEASNLCRLLAQHPETRFDLFHIGYPFQNEVAAIAKHYPNVYVDFCWAWAIDPYSTSDFLRRMIHAVPDNRLFIFGGDTGWPNSSAAYAKQARRWIGSTLQREIDDGFLTENQAIELAERYMLKNQRDCFRLDS
ncbi:MAG: amidohydrolase family protein [Spirochaetales bacterium]|jgi:uncharacterized protein|nr:amidohydrolase family protein [Spirochaetales bacterium]